MVYCYTYIKVMGIALGQLIGENHLGRQNLARILRILSLALTPLSQEDIFHMGILPLPFRKKIGQSALLVSIAFQNNQHTSVPCIRLLCSVLLPCIHNNVAWSYCSFPHSNHCYLMKDTPDNEGD